MSMVIAMVTCINNNCYAPKCKLIFLLVIPLTCKNMGVAKGGAIHKAYCDINKNVPCVRELIVSLVRGNLLFFAYNMIASRTSNIKKYGIA